MTRLINSNLNDMLNYVDQYKKTVQDAFYEHYKNICVLTETNNFRGEGAKAYKEYLATVTINYINAFINISEEISVTLEKMKSNYISLEPNESGSIDTDILEYVKGNLSNRKENFQSLVGEIDSLNNKAYAYISVENLNTMDIIETYNSIDRELCNINDELINIDSTSLAEAENLLDRINVVTYQLKNISNSYHADNKILEDKVKEIIGQYWYKKENNNNLNTIIKEDPFYYNSDAKYNSEGQWARGLATDTFIYGGYTTLGGAYNVNMNKGILSGDINASGFNAYEKVQVTEYFKHSASISVLSATASGKMGASREQFGLQTKGSVVVADANTSSVLGTDKFNGYVKANATALSASGYANEYYKAKNGDFGMGFGGKAALAEASASAGVSFLTVPGEKDKKEYAGGKVKTSTETSLLGGSAKVKAGISASADFNIQSTRVLDFGKVNVNALNVKLGGCLGLGVELDVTVPIPTIDMPWED